MTLREAKAIWVSFVGVLKVHNALEIKATFLKQCFPNCFLQSSRTPRGAAPHKCIAKEGGESWFPGSGVFRTFPDYWGLEPTATARDIVLTTHIAAWLLSRFCDFHITDENFNPPKVE